MIYHLKEKMIPAQSKSVHLCLPDPNDKIFKDFFYRGPDFDFGGDSPGTLLIFIDALRQMIFRDFDCYL